MNVCSLVANRRTRRTIVIVLGSKRRFQPEVKMKCSRSLCVILAGLCQWLLLVSSANAHPASGIVVDDQGCIYFLFDSLYRIDPSGKLSVVEENAGGHWLALDAKGAFANAKPKIYKRATPDGVTPALIYGDGAPLVIGLDGNLYYGTNGSQEESFPAGAMTVARMSPRGEQSLFAPSLKQTLTTLNDGITGLSTGPDGSIYAATWNGIVKLSKDGSIAKIMHPIAVKDCDSDPADHNPANASSPLFRGLGVDANGNVYVAATSCHRVVRITPRGEVRSILISERPWSATGVAVSGRDLFVLEYTNANGPRTEGWKARVRKIAADHTVTTLAAFSTPLPSPPAKHRIK
jgi:sugar lactone lactonase YvrE